MAKIHGDCPHCKEKVTIDIDKLEVKQPKDLTNASAEGATTQQIQKEPEVKEVIKEVTKIPSFIPQYKCKDGRCGNIHPNPDYAERPNKKCDNCGQFNSGDTCVWCGGKDFDELDEEELDDLNIPKPQIHDHDHE